MQTQNLTITTETIQAVGELLRITSFEMKTIGFCDVCGTQQTVTTESLQIFGWFLGSREHFCPNCNY